MITKKLWFNLALTGLLMVVTVALLWAGKMGLVDREVPMRWPMALFGVMLAIYANAIPKAAAPASPRRMMIQRVTGWTFLIAALANTAVWLFAPIEIMAVASMVPLLTAFGVAMGYCVWLRTKPA